MPVKADVAEAAAHNGLTCFCLDRPVSGCEAPGLLGAGPSPAALVPNPAMAAAAAAAAAVAAVGSAGREPPAAAVADVLPDEAPPCTSSVTPASPVVLRPADGKLGMKDTSDYDSHPGGTDCYRQATACHVDAGSFRKQSEAWRLR